MERYCRQSFRRRRPRHCSRTDRLPHTRYVGRRPAGGLRSAPRRCYLRIDSCCWRRYPQHDTRDCCCDAGTTCLINHWARSFSAAVRRDDDRNQIRLWIYSCRRDSHAGSPSIRRRQNTGEDCSNTAHSYSSGRLRRAVKVCSGGHAAADPAGSSATSRHFC